MGGVSLENAASQVVKVAVVDAKTRARLGGLTRASLYSGSEMTANARKAFADRFTKLVLENAAANGESLTEGEVLRRAAAARKIYFLRLAARSADARRRRRASA
jgi:hypothetical protein